MEESGVFTFPNRNGRVYDINAMTNAIKDWAKNNGVWVDRSVKDVNGFYRDKKARDNNSSKFFGVDPQSIFIDYIDVMRP